MKERNSKFELLRILCIVLIIASHFTMYKGDLGEVGTINYYIGNIIRSFCIVSVNCFVLISGYFGIKFNIKKIIKLDLTVIFYTIILFLISIIFGIHTISFKNDIVLLLPILTKRYWFITIYILLCFLSPILNLIVSILKKEQYKKFLLFLIVVFYILPILSYLLNAPTITMDSGYGIINFICLYFIGRYINLYYEDNWKPSKYLVVYIVCSILIFLFNHLFTKIFGFYFNSFLSYDTLFVLISSIMLFLFFKNISISSKVINTLAEGCFAVYIIHMNPTLSKYIFIDILNVKKYHGLNYILAICIMPIVMFLLLTIVELIRLKILGTFENNLEIGRAHV